MAKAAPRKRRVTGDARTRKMRAVLAACRRLGIDDDARKDLQAEIVQVASMAEMSEAQLGQLLDHLNRDWQGTNPARPHIAKIKALWWSLYWLGAIDEPGDQALSAFVKRQTGIAALRFLDHRGAPSVIEALKSWLEREGVIWPEAGPTDELDNRWAVVRAIAGKIASAGHPVDPRAQKGLANQWNARQLDEIISQMGKQWRALRP